MNNYLVNGVFWCLLTIALLMEGLVKVGIFATLSVLIAVSMMVYNGVMFRIDQRSD